jgi:hypothetical protein
MVDILKDVITGAQIMLVNNKIQEIIRNVLY